MKLKLTKALAFIDLETTGLDVATDRIVEISVLKIEPDSKRSVFTRRLNPGIPISPESSAIHGIHDEDVRNEPDFRSIGPDLKNFLGNADLAGFNSNKFDIPLLVEEFLRHGLDFDRSKRKMIDVQNIFHKMEKRSLEAAYRFYCQKELINAHSAAADVEATYEVLEAQLEKYSELEATSTFLHEFSALHDNVDLAGRIVRNSKGVEIFNFGKHKGKAVTDVFKSDPSYYSWMLNAEFTNETKERLKELMFREKTGK